MSSIARMLLLGAALSPYAALVGFDAWMHERARHVPRLEKGLHYAAAMLFIGFVVSVFRDATRPALALLAAFVAVAAWDEIGFHAPLEARERRVHFLSYAALAVFVGAWYALDSTG